MQIDIEKIKDIKLEGDKLFLSPQADEAVFTLLTVQRQIEEALKTIGEQVALAGAKYNPNFKSIQSDRIKGYYREYGAKYYLKEEDVERCPKELYKREVKYKVESEKVDKYVEENKGLPIGIAEVDRKKSLSFSLKKEKSNDNA